MLEIKIAIIHNKKKYTIDVFKTGQTKTLNHVRENSEVTANYVMLQVSGDVITAMRRPLMSLLHCKGPLVIMCTLVSITVSMQAADDIWSIPYNVCPAVQS